MAAKSRISFFDSLIKIGHGFQEIFGFFGNAIGDAFGFTVVKSGDKRSKVGEHFEKIKKGLGDTKNKLKELSNKISETKNANGSTIEAVKGAISSANNVFERLIASLTKLADTAGNTEITDANTGAAAVGAEEASVKTMIDNIKEMLEVAKISGVRIEAGNPGIAVAASAQTDAPAVLGGNAQAGAGDKLADEVAKADPWAMIDKIKNTKVKTGNVSGDNTNEAGALAAGTGVDNAGAKSNADLAAAVALKAITKGGKFSNAANEAGAVKAAAVTAVNKVLGVLDVIIRKTVSSNLDKIREAVKGIQYSETTTESTEASSTTQPAAAK
ncbi:Variable major protein (plasmid) [Borrelia parkeri SLO]|uniref:Variable large protein n=1 Tax=Borrelia parkeri SLO TaxID=1313294 RepID=W5SSY3_BORPR|nr:Variable major protein [Borrelia parkeri SLO]UPA11385.1 variable large family protein [Borrelia parkeri]